MDITQFVERTLECTKIDMLSPNVVNRLFINTVEEVGELAAAITVEAGLKPHKILKEDAKTEAVDVMICALSVFFALGGTVEEISKIGNSKLDKWAWAIKNRQAE